MVTESDFAISPVDSRRFLPCAYQVSSDSWLRPQQLRGCCACHWEKPIDSWHRGIRSWSSESRAFLRFVLNMLHTETKQGYESLFMTLCVCVFVCCVCLWMCVVLFLSYATPSLVWNVNSYAVAISTAGTTWFSLLFPPPRYDSALIPAHLALFKF